MDRMPLSYGSLKAVIQYMDPNARFQIRQKCPTIRPTEKLFPLKIDKLELDPENVSISMNETSYQIGVISRYNNAETPDNVRNTTKLYDIDRYGFMDRAAEMTPGDLMTSGDFDATELSNCGAAKVRDEYQLTQLKKRFTFFNQIRVEREKFPKTQEMLCTLEKLDKRIKEVREKIIPYQLRLDNEQPNITNYLELTIEGFSPKIEYVEYNQKLGVAMKYLTSKMLGGQREPILVKHLKVTRTGCVRLPENLKIVVRQLSVHSNVTKTLNGIQSIFDQRSFPLETIFLNESNYSFEHQIIKTAQKLVITGYLRFYTVRDLAFSNSRVDFRTEPNVASDILITFVKEWQERGRDIGTHYSFSIDKKEEVQKTLDVIEKEDIAKFGELKETRLTPFPKCVTFPLNYNSEINIYGEEVNKNNSGVLQWILHVKVQPIGQATPLKKQQYPAKRAKLSETND